MIRRLVPYYYLYLLPITTCTCLLYYLYLPPMDCHLGNETLNPKPYFYLARIDCDLPSTICNLPSTTCNLTSTTWLGLTATLVITALPGGVN